MANRSQRQAKLGIRYGQPKAIASMAVSAIQLGGSIQRRHPTIRLSRTPTAAIFQPYFASEDTFDRC